MAACLCALLTCVVICGCSQIRGPYIKNNLERDLDTIRPGTLTVASDFASPPMEFVDSDGQRRGFEYDLVCEVAERLSLDVEFVACDDLAAVDAAVGNRVADLGASAIMLGDFASDTFFNLVPGSAYMTAGRDVIVPRDRPIKGIEQLNDPSCTIVVQGGPPTRSGRARPCPAPPSCPSTTPWRGSPGCPTALTPPPSTTT